MDLVLDNAVLSGRSGTWDIAIRSGRIAQIAPAIRCDCPRGDLRGRLVLPGFVDSHIHLDKACLLGRCDHAANVKQAMQEVSREKARFTAQDVYARGARVVEQAIMQGTTHMRTHVELDPVVGLRGLEGVTRLKRDYAWALDMQICVFPQDGLINNPGTLELLEEALASGEADLVGGCPYADSAPLEHLRQVFDLARRHDCDIDLHLDFDLDPSTMLVETACDLTDEYGWGGRVTAGHVTKLSMLEQERWLDITRRLRNCGVAITALPATDLYLLGREYPNSVPRGVVPVHRLAEAGVGASIATNNVMNPFTPFGDCSLLRMANLYANVCHVDPGGFGAVIDLVTNSPARLMRLADYGLAEGCAADLVVLDADNVVDALGGISLPLAAYKNGRRTFSRPVPVLDRPSSAFQRPLKDRPGEDPYRHLPAAAGSSARDLP